MINRLQLLRNIGKFDSVNAAANILLARLTLIYAENGRGKTTLAAILRSLATGDPIPIFERRRLTAQNPPHVVVDCIGGPPPAIFENNAWNRVLPNMVVFDDVFVNDNVYSGLVVEAGHRQNLHELILGTQGVKLNQQLQEFIARIETHNTALRTKAAAIPAAARGTISVEEFCALPARADIDENIQVAERTFAAAKEQAPVRDTAAFNALSLPAFDVDAVEHVLQQDLPGLDAAAAARVQAHLAGIGPGAEAWIADGMERLQQQAPVNNDGICPFCAQGLSASAVIRHYRVYFSEVYATLKRTVANSIAAVNRTHSGDMSAAFERSVRIASERRQFWSRFCDVPELALDTAAIARDWRAAREAVAYALGAKRDAPLERMALAHEARAAVHTYETHRQSIAKLSQQLLRTNAAIGIVKEQAAIGNPAAIAADISRLKAVKARHTPAIALAVDEYLAEGTAKTQTEQNRDQAKTALDRYRTNVFPGYETAINLYLQKFNAGFRLTGVTSANTRGGPACTYNVVINNTPVAVAGAAPAPGEPSFRNTLSAGDRNTLALAFFFASLDQDPDLADKVVVVDDPISSLDEHRALTTVQELRGLAQRASQVIVLSHTKALLCRLWEGADRTIRGALQLARDGAGSTIRTWDVTQDCNTEHDRRHSLLRGFLVDGSGDSREVARAIRPLLEAFLRVACPEQFPPGTLLGPFRSHCEQTVGSPQEILGARDIQELRDLTEYVNRFHHDTNPAWEIEAINDGELTGFVGRALRFARRYAYKHKHASGY